MDVAARLTCALLVPCRIPQGWQEWRHPPPLAEPVLAPSPDPAPSARTPSGARGAERAGVGRSLRRAALWLLVAAVVLGGVYFYFAYSRSVTPLRVGG